MPKFRKLVGVHWRKEDGKEVGYKPGDIIEATEEELRKHDPTLNTWKALEELPEAPKLPDPESLKVVRIEGTKEFNVINTATNKPINDVPLSRKDAFSLVKNSEVTEKE